MAKAKLEDTFKKEELESDNDFYQALLVSSQSYIAEREGVLKRKLKATSLSIF